MENLADKINNLNAETRSAIRQLTLDTLGQLGVLTRGSIDPINYLTQARLYFEHFSLSLASV